jgi:hypothetical protein
VWSYNGKALSNLYEIADTASKFINPSSSETLRIMHGDFCFTNIFYDFRTQKVKVIDPRGSIDSFEPSVYGDVRYDMAKLNHSISGGYDFILANRFECFGFEKRDLTIKFFDQEKINLLKIISSSFSIGSLSLCDNEINAMTIHLFLSMLPLHKDRPDRQQAFIANALRLYMEIFE